jgi:hypothetical protein
VLNGTPSLFSLTGGIRTLDGLQNQVPEAWRDLLHYFSGTPSRGSKLL